MINKRYHLHTPKILLILYTRVQTLIRVKQVASILKTSAKILNIPRGGYSNETPRFSLKRFVVPSNESVVTVLKTNA